MSKKIIVSQEIPTGEYCEGCVYLNNRSCRRHQRYSLGGLLDRMGAFNWLKCPPCLKECEIIENRCEQS